MQFEDKYLKGLVKPIKLNSSIKVELSAAINTAVIFVPDSSHRDLSVSNRLGLMQWICDPVMPEILTKLKSHTSSCLNTSL